MAMSSEHLKPFHWFEHKEARVWPYTPILLKESLFFLCFVHWDSVYSSIITKQQQQRKEPLLWKSAENISVVKTFQITNFNGSTLKSEHKSIS